MKLNTLRRTGGIAAATLTLSLGLAACGGDEPATTSSGDTTQSAEPAQEEQMEEDASAQTYGAGCGVAMNPIAALFRRLS